MMNLHVIQAEFGDCFILEYKNQTKQNYILIDGGPGGKPRQKIFEKHLKDQLVKINSKGGKLDLIVVSHIDEDHIYGILELFLFLREQILEDENQDPLINIKALWHNSFKKTIDPDNYITNELDNIYNTSSFGSQAYNIADYARYSIGQGNNLTNIVEAHNIPINPNCQQDLVSVETKPELTFDENFKLIVVGPTKNNLENLKTDWLNWIENKKKNKPTSNLYFEAMADNRYANLSSIMFIAKENNKTILFTGDGRGDHLIEGLRERGLLDQNDTIHVDILKIPHHGSEENISKEFFNQVQAKTYIISANGKNNNPDLTTLTWLVESAKERQEKITIFVTNETDNTKKLLKKYPPSENNYALQIMKPNTSITTIKT